jgi:hypothetical protein
MQENQISIDFTQEELDTISKATQTLQNVLSPKLVKLNAELRRELAKMGDKTLAFVVKSYEHAKQNPTLTPSYIDVEEMQKDIKAVEVLRQICNPLQELSQDIEDSMMLSGSEAYIAALSFYNAIKGAAKSKVGASEQIYNDLSQRFPGRPRKNTGK